MARHNFNLLDAAIVLQISPFRIWLYLAGLSCVNLDRDLYLIGRMIAVSEAEELVAVL
jgi:hypothetical protein